MLKKEPAVLTCLGLLVFLCLTSLILRYQQLDRIPYGFHVDEMSSSVDIGCLVSEGVDADNVPYPLFSSVNYGTPKPPTYLYPAFAWAKVFGYSAPSLRALSVSMHLLGIIGLFFLARSFFGWRCAVLTATAACLSPWTWNISRVAFESLFAVTFLIGGMYFFFKSPKIYNSLLSALFLTAAMYSYPPIRVQAPLMVLSLIAYAHYKYPRPLKSWGTFGLTMVLFSIPLIQKVLSGELQGRFNTISIFSSASGSDIGRSFINNFFIHFSPDFLFLTGDPSYVHSTRHFGILSWLDILALSFGVIWLFMLIVGWLREGKPEARTRRSDKGILLLLLANILIGVLPAALTNSELPNALRITGAWPFSCLLSGYLLWQACEKWWGAWIITTLTAILFAMVFFNVYFKAFPQEGKGMFAYWTLDQAKELKTDEDWLKFVMLYRRQDYNARYYLMQYKGVGCTQSRKIWNGVNELLKSHGSP